MGNCLFAFPDYSQVTSQWSPEFSGGLWQATLPLSNLQQSKLFPPARSTSLAEESTWFHLDLKTPRPIKVLSIANHNSSSTGRITVNIWKDSTMTNLIYSTGWQLFWPDFYDFGDRDWLDSEFWSLKLSEEDMAGYKPNWVHVLPESVLGKYITVQIHDPDNTDGFFQMSRFIPSRGWKPDINMSYGSNISWATDTVSRKTPNSKTFFNARPAYRKAIVNLDNLSKREGLGMAFEMDRRLGIHGQLLFVWDVDDRRLTSLQRSFLATIESPNPLEYPSFGINTKSYSLVEVL